MPKVAYVIFGVDDDRPSSSNAAPYTFQIDTTALSDGAHWIFAEAYDNYGLLASSKIITIHVKNGSAPLVQARKAPATKVAAKAKPAAPVAKAAPPAAGSVAGKEAAAAVTADTAAAAPPTSSTAPITLARGPLPEPARSEAATAVSPAATMVPETGSRPSFAAAAATDLPRAVRQQPGAVRGHTLLVNGQPVRFSVEPFVDSGRMHAGFRGLFQQAGAKVTWHRGSRSARGVKGTETVEVVADSRLAMVNGRQVDMGANASIREARMMIPLRFFAAVAGAALYWDQGRKVANLRSDNRAMAEWPLTR